MTGRSSETSKQRRKSARKKVKAISKSQKLAASLFHKLFGNCIYISKHRKN